MIRSYFLLSVRVPLCAKSRRDEAPKRHSERTGWQAGCPRRGRSRQRVLRRRRYGSPTCLNTCVLELYIMYYITFRCFWLLESDCTQLCRRISWLLGTVNNRGRRLSEQQTQSSIAYSPSRQLTCLTSSVAVPPVATYPQHTQASQHSRGYESSAGTYVGVTSGPGPPLLPPDCALTQYQDLERPPRR